MRELRENWGRVSIMTGRWKWSRVWLELKLADRRWRVMFGCWAAWLPSVWATCWLHFILITCQNNLSSAGPAGRMINAARRRASHWVSVECYATLLMPLNAAHTHTHAHTLNLVNSLLEAVFMALLGQRCSGSHKLVEHCHKTQPSASAQYWTLNMETLLGRSCNIVQVPSVIRAKIFFALQ